MDGNYKVIKYPNNDIELANILVGKKLYRNENEISSRIKYLSSYLRLATVANKKLPPSFVLVENHYVSSSFLMDYKKYYSNSYSKFSKYTKRFHFFSNSCIEGEEKKEPKLFEDLYQFKLFENPNLSDDQILINFFLNSPEAVVNEYLNNYYLGFVVVKNLEGSIIGPSLLKVPVLKDYNNKSFYNSNFEYKIHILGHEYTLNSLVFQEQDRAVAACATNSLWFAFHSLKTLFNSLAPSLVEITESASLSSNGIRLIPNLGMDYKQISTAIYSAGLVPDTSSELTLLQLRRLVYAYNKCKIPILLAISSRNLNGNVGGHMILIVGYRMSKKLSSTKDTKTMFDKRKANEITFISDDIDLLYAHDDQLGPFAKIGLGDIDYSAQKKLQPYLSNKNNKSIYFHWLGDNKSPATLKAAIVPLTPKLRIQYSDVADSLLNIISPIFVSILSSHYGEKYHISKLKWEIYLTSSEDYKADIKKLFYNSQNENDYKTIIKQKVCTSFYPKFIWIVRLHRERQILSSEPFIKVVDIVIDPTSPIRSELESSLMQLNFFNSKVKFNFYEMLKSNKYINSFNSMSVKSRNCTDFILKSEDNSESNRYRERL